MTKRAALYLRQSKADDEGIERQRDRTTALSAARGWTIVETYVDNDVSASKPRGSATAWGRLLSASESIDVVIATDLDRIARSTRDLNTLIDHKLALVTVDGEIDLASADGELRASVLASVARFEVRRKAERQRRAGDQRAALGRPTSRPGYGYRRVDRRDVIDQAEAAVIRDVARRALEGHSIRSITADLNRRGVPSPRTAEQGRTGESVARIEWSSPTLRQLLLRPSLAGLRTHRGEVVGEFDPDWHPSILDRDTHDRLVALFRNPSRESGGVGKPPKHLLSGIIYCGRCEAQPNAAPAVMRRASGKLVTTRDGRTKRQPPSYFCTTCYKVRRKQEDVERVVVGTLLRRLQQPDALALFTRGDDAAASTARNAIAAIDARLSNAADAYAAGALELGQLTRITAQLREDRATHEAVLARSLPTAIPTDIAGPEVETRWDALGLDSQRAILRAVMRVTILPSGPGRAFNPELVRIEWKSHGEEGS
ncbi:recombinase family protein [Microbacterium aquimaris]|uniref:Recombinase family protein n=1 Tax=Microbacterium aquimaris TaxID=459816 RepID=A0ABU5N7B6_9MICO|nr:recombinase family protein [Microbacterium aquimaris]MDZ8161998.1 recombinase family protein [Microbacterium aquimaris]